MTSSLRTFFFASGLLVSSGFSHADESVLDVVSVNYPLKYFAESIAGKHVKVALPMPADIDPAFWEPKADDINALQQADLILLNGAEYAKWLPKVSLSLFKQVNTSSLLRDQYLPVKEELVHNHGSGGKHSHKGTAFTTWLDFSFAEQQAHAMYQAFVKKMPVQKPMLEENFKGLQTSLKTLDGDLLKIGKSLEGVALLGSHPVYQYLKNRYQLNLQSVHWEPEDAPSEQQWETLKQIVKTHPAKWMLWEGKPAEETVKKLAALGIKSVLFTPCANAPEKGDFLSIMQDNVARLKTVIPQ